MHGSLWRCRSVQVQNLTDWISPKLYTVPVYRTSTFWISLWLTSEQVLWLSWICHNIKEGVNSDSRSKVVPEPSSGPSLKDTIHWHRRNRAENMNTQYFFSLSVSFPGCFSLASVRLWRSLLEGPAKKRPEMYRCKVDIKACSAKKL